MNTKDIWHWLDPLACGWGAEEKLRAQSPVLLWASTGLGSMARPLYMDRGVLHLAVGSHVVAAEFNLLKSKLLARLEEVDPQCGVVDLRFQIRAEKRPPREIVVVPPTSGELRQAKREVPAGLPSRLQHVAAQALAWAEARDRAILSAGGWRCAECGLALVKEKKSCPLCGFERSHRDR